MFESLPLTFRICLICILFCKTIYSNEWTRFRGPNGTGIAKEFNFAHKWTDKDFKWFVDLPGVGHSSPVVWNNKLFTTCGDPKKGSLFITCINIINGAVNWERKISFAPYPHHKFNSLASCSPCVNAKFLFVSWTTADSNNLVCLNHDGKILWKQDFGEYNTQHGSGFSPITHGNKLIVSHDHENDSSLIALNQETGDIMWKTDRIGSKPSSSTPFILSSNLGFDQIIASSMSHGCYSVNTQNGEIIWETGPGSLDKRAVSSPIKSGNLILATCGAGTKGSRLISVNPKKYPKNSDLISYARSRDVPYVPTPLAIGKLIFLLGDGGIASCMERDSGKILWRERLEGNYFASPIAIGKTLLIVSRQGLVTTLKFNNQEMKVLGKSQLNELTHNTPAVSNGSIFFRTYSKLFCLPSKKDQI